MSESDKTRQKLIDSMRKTKAGTTAKPRTATKANAEKAGLPSSQSPGDTSKETKQARPEEKVSAVNSVYQRRPRVWPD
ncbi:MAG: hypothetical protein R6X06_02805 [Gammaproteobacteria bacterium]